MTMSKLINLRAIFTLLSVEKHLLFMEMPHRRLQPAVLPSVHGFDRTQWRLLGKAPMAARCRSAGALVSGPVAGEGVEAFGQGAVENLDTTVDLVP